MRLSIVIPCYNESDNVGELHKRLSRLADDLVDPTNEPLEFEFIFVDDGSRDATLARLKELIERDARVQAVSLSRNFGHQAALSAGIDHATGDAVVVMDADLQHPPELIAQFIEKWRAGYELIYAYREGVKPRLGYRFINAVMRIQVPPEAADFRLMDRRVVEAFKAMPERARFIRGMLSWLGFKQIGIGYRQADRFAGERAYSLKQTARMALHAILAFSTLPLRAAAFLGLGTLCLGIIYAIYILYAWLAGRPIEPGWTGLMMAILLLGGVQLICLGIIAEYIGCIFEEVKRRPLYVVREHIVARPPADVPPQPQPKPRRSDEFEEPRYKRPSIFT